MRFKSWQRRHPPKPHPKGKLPVERLWGGMLAGLRYARHSPATFAQLVRTLAYSGLGSALWALLPVIAQRQLGLGAAGFGLLMGCLGTGAVAAGFFIARLRTQLGLDALAAGCCVIFAGAMFVAVAAWIAPLCGMLAAPVLLVLLGYSWAKRFTELAHIWLGDTALSDLDPRSTRTNAVERRCNQVAAEFLVPMAEFRSRFDPTSDLQAQLQPLAAHFRVSAQVILGQIREAGGLTWDQYLHELEEERARVAALIAERGSGGNYYNTKPVQIGKRIARVHRLTTTP